MLILLENRCSVFAGEAQTELFLFLILNDPHCCSDTWMHVDLLDCVLLWLLCVYEH